VVVGASQRSVAAGGSRPWPMTLLYSSAVRRAGDADLYLAQPAAVPLSAQTGVWVATQHLAMISRAVSVMDSLSYGESSFGCR
jgi:hypothetical protein